ncbi:MAG: polysaccharide biosynthesis C-terminal domain-containing protein [Oscillospiraceae bacterium]|nr:polysaccharide biosynthesis C-terminal domain-containing protein [Oscillospiraceae bacterium]
MNKYKKLMSNTLIFAIGTFSSKILTILMTRFNTAALGSDFGTASVLQDMGNVLIPLFSLQIVDGVTRFGLDRRYNKKDVFTVSLLVTCIGAAVLLILSPLLEKIPGLTFIQGRSLLVAIFVFTSSLRNMCSQFVRAREMVKLYAFEGILTTFTTVVFTLLFLYPLHMGVTGFMLGIILPDLLGAIFLFWTADLKQFVRFRGLDHLTAAQMLKYSAPLIPNKIAFWITNCSDRMMVQVMTNKTISSVFAASYKIPNLISLVVSVFLDAWQMSSITEEKGRARFFTQVFHAMSAIIFVGSALVILLCRPLINLLTAHSFHVGWVYVPILVLATAFSCLCSFLGTVYMVEKRSINNMVTTIIAAVINVILNLLLIRKWGPQGAATATLISYLVMFVIRVIDTRRFIRVHFSPMRLLADSLLLSFEAFVMIKNVSHSILYCALLTLLMIIMNFQPLMQSVRKVLPANVLEKMPTWLSGEKKSVSVQKAAPHTESTHTREAFARDEEYARSKKPAPQQHHSHGSSSVDEEDGFDYEAYLQEQAKKEDKDFSHDRYRH